MDHFAVVQSLIRAALVGDKEGALKQVVRLRERLSKEGDVNQADTITRLLAAAADIREIEPSRIEVSRASVTGERLTPEVQIPIDRETGARLCTVNFPSESMVFEPVHNATVNATIGGILAEWANVGGLKDVGVQPTRSLLIFGPPGSGKTVTAHFVARRLGLPLVTARIDGLVSSFLGTTARNIANLFDFANRYACVLLLDEFDALAKLRDDPQEVGEIKRVVNTLLQNLDFRAGRGVTIAITNHERLLDPAVWRRFESQLHMSEPGDHAREGLIQRFLAPIHAEPDLVTLYSYCLEGSSGADVQRICDGVKRIVGIGRETRDSAGLFRALAAVLSRLPVHDHPPARYLTHDLDWFVSFAANDKTLKMKQDALGEIVGRTQSQVSRLKSDKPYLKVSADAQ